MEDKRPMRVYISGKVTGTDDFEARFQEAEHTLVANGCAVLNPVRVNRQLPDGLEYEQLMNVCFTLLDMADAVCMLDGWRTSPGANREYGYALAKGLEIFGVEA